jgi:hypothetical protein
MLILLTSLAPQSENVVKSRQKSSFRPASMIAEPPFALNQHPGP